MTIDSNIAVWDIRPKYEVQVQYRAVWPGGSTSAPLPSRVPLDDEAKKRGVPVTIETRTAHYTAWEEAT